jgi:hypothetical protein
MAATDLFVALTGTGVPIPQPREWGAPYEVAFDITPHNTNELPYVTRAIYVGGVGDLRIKTMNGETVTFSAVPTGTTLNIRAVVVLNQGTDATGLIGLT